MGPKSFALMTVVLICACNSPTAPRQRPAAVPSSPGPASPVTPLSPTSTRFRVRGTVMDEAGAALPGVILEVWFRPGTGGFSSHSLRCPFTETCWVEVRTDNSGFYEVEFDARQISLGGVGGIAALIQTSGGGAYQFHAQAVPFVQPDVVRNIRMRWPVRISAGQSTTVSIDVESSFCADSEDLLLLHSRCVLLTVETSQPGTLTVDARAQGGGVTPTVYWTTSGNYVVPTRIGTGISLQVNGGPVAALVGVPAAALTQRVDVTTTFR